MAPETSPRPRPRPGDGFSVEDLWDWLDLPSRWDAVRSWALHSDEALGYLAFGIAGASLIFIGATVIRRRRSARQGPCRWKKARRQRGGALTAWECKACWAEGFSHDGRPPKECKKALRVTPL